MTHKLSEVVPLDDYIREMKKTLAGLEFDDPKFDLVSREITAAYLAITRGEAYHVPF